MLPSDLLDLIAPASAGNCSPGELVAIMVGVPVGILLLSPVLVLVDLAREAFQRVA
jgi:hypothetical protein